MAPGCYGLYQLISIKLDTNTQRTDGTPALHTEAASAPDNASTPRCSAGGAALGEGAAAHRTPTWDGSRDKGTESYAVDFIALRLSFPALARQR